ncbi:MAG TPA: YqgE/AlgH family protein [Gammaproteobacteria bacterium]|nr:YqgE/AlgH family protein [Gammaproteobacteria bacterium]
MKSPKESQYYQNHFLVAMPSMEDPSYHHTVMFICEHNENGAVAIIINRPTTISLADVLSDMKINVQDDVVRHIPVLFGGPVHQERGFVVHRPKGAWRSTLLAGEDIFITTSKDILEALAIHQGPKDVLIALGCCAWEPGQLEQEILANTWLTMPATSQITFDIPFDTRYTEAMGLLGINLANLSDEAGHA